jgi:hypothetical protein
MDTNLDTSDWRLWVMCVVILGCLAFWLAAVFLAARSQSARGQSARSQKHSLAVATVGDDSTAEPHPPVPRPALDRDTSVPMPAQRAEPATGNVRPVNRS